MLYLYISCQMWKICFCNCFYTLGFSMKSYRVFNFIYNGFIGERQAKLLPVSPLDELKSILKVLGISVDGREAISTSQYRALMSIDLLHRFSVHSNVDYKQSKPWPMQYNYLYSMGHSEKKSSLNNLKRLNFDVEQINEIYAHYGKIKLLEGNIAEWVKFMDLNDKVYDACENIGQKNKVFTKCFVDLIYNQLLNHSYELPPELKLQKFIYINHAIAINIITSIDSQSVIKNSGININQKHVLSFYLMLIKNDLMSKDVNAIHDRLQAFIDLFIFGAYRYGDELKTRREFIENVVSATFEKCAHMKVEVVYKKIISLSDYGGECLDYMTKIPFRKYKDKQWYKDMCEVAILKGQYSSLIVAMLSFMPRNTDLNEVLDKAKNALKERVNKREYSGDRRVLNVKVDSEIFDMLDDIQSEFGLKKRLDAVMKAIREAHSYYFGKSRPKGTGAGVLIESGSKITSHRRKSSSTRKMSHVKPTRNYTGYSKNNAHVVQSNNDLGVVEPVHTTSEKQLKIDLDGDEENELKALQAMQPDAHLDTPSFELVDNNVQLEGSILDDAPVSKSHNQQQTSLRQKTLNETRALDHIDDGILMELDTSESIIEILSQNTNK